MATKRSWKLRYDGFVNEVRPDPKSVDEKITIIAGFIGQSSERGHIRVFFDEALESFIDLKEADILYAEPLPEESSPMGGSKLWVKAKAEYQFGDPGEKERSKMSFLRGDIIAAYQDKFGPALERTPDVKMMTYPTICNFTCYQKTCQVETCLGKTCLGPTCNMRTCDQPTCLGRTCLQPTCYSPTCLNLPTCQQSCYVKTCFNVTCNDFVSCHQATCFNKTCLASCLQISCGKVSCFKTCNQTCFHYSPDCFLTETIDLDQFGQIGHNPLGGGTGFETFNPYMG